MSAKEAAALGTLDPADLDENIEVSPNLPESIREKATLSYGEQNKLRKLKSVKYASKDLRKQYEIFLPDKELKCYSRFCIISPLRIGTKVGGLYIPDKARADNDYLATIGMLVAIGENFYNNEWFSEATIRPQIGDVVMYRKYGGVIVAYKNEDFRLDKDIDIFMPITDPVDPLDFAKLL